MTVAGRSVAYDTTARTLVMAGHRREFGPEPSNRQVLEGYVDLVTECRGRPLTGLAQVRDEDVDALATALDLDADRLIEEIEAVLALSPAQAVTLVDRLRRRRVLLAGAVVAAGLVVGGVAIATNVGGDAPTTREPSTTTVAGTSASTTDPPTGQAPSAPETTIGEPPPVELIPPETVDAGGTASTIVEGDATLLEPQPTIVSSGTQPGP